MRRSAAVLLLLALLAGCLGQTAPDTAGPGEVAQADEPTRVGRSPVDAAKEEEDDKVRSPGAGQLSAPLLVNVSAQLRKSAAEVVAAPGEFLLVRLVYDKEIWGEEEPWDGSASVLVGYAYDINGSGVYMRAFGFQPPSFSDERTIRPYVDFFPVEGKGWGWSSTSSSCSGCDESVPRHESALLVGGPGGATLRIGVLGDEDDPESLWDRPAVVVGADAGTKDAFAGYAVRVVSLASETSAVMGALTASWSDALAPGVALQRTADYSGKVVATEPGILSARLYGRETAGVEQWSYSMAAPQLSGGWDGVWLHEPYGAATFLTLTGAAYPPLVYAQGNIGVGDVLFEAHRTTTAASEPTGLVSPSLELAILGHAGVDLEALFGWDTDRLPSPDAGFEVLDCMETSLEPGIRNCVGSLPARQS